MQCRFCNTELPVNVAHCPGCGQAVTSVSSSSDPPEPPSTQYGPSEQYGPPYEIPQQNPDQVLNPYTAPPLPLPRQNRRFGLLAGIVALLVLLVIFVGIGVAAWIIASSVHPSRSSLTAFATSVPIKSTVPYGNMPYAPFRGTLVLSDPLRDNSQGYQWQERKNGPYSCGFTDGTYHSKSDANYFFPCRAQNTDFANFAYEVQMTILTGNCGGLLFRMDSSMMNFYQLRICQNGTCRLAIVCQNVVSVLTSDISDPAIKAGLNQTNLLAVVANGSMINFYINQQHIESLSNSAYSHGEIAVFAGSISSPPTEVAFSNARVWNL